MRYRHKKRGTNYTKIGVARLNVATEYTMNAAYLYDGDDMAVYLSDSGTLSVRRDSEFHDGRFEEIAASENLPGMAMVGIVASLQVKVFDYKILTAALKVIADQAQQIHDLTEKVRDLEDTETLAAMAPSGPEPTEAEPTPAVIAAVEQIRENIMSALTTTDGLLRDAGVSTDPFTPLSKTNDEQIRVGLLKAISWHEDQIREAQMMPSHNTQIKIRTHQGQLATLKEALGLPT